MDRFIPFPAFADRGPLDVSFLFTDEKPAGKHGFLTVNGEDFVFEDGTPARFWGTNFNGGACFPEKEYARKVARRLAMYGCNIVRFHQLDAEWNTPNIYHLAKGEYTGTTRVLNPECLDRLDYLISCLKAEGIYCYMDLMTYRKFKKGDGVDVPELLKDSAKPYSVFDRRMIDLQKEFATQFWSHRNPYTGLEHRNDPVFVMCEVTNESDVFQQPIEVEPYVSRFRALFADWLLKTGREGNADTVDVNGDDPALIDFKVELQRKYYAEVIGHCRSIGVKIPMYGNNNNMCVGNDKSQMDGDFADTHPYFYDWSWGEREKRCQNKGITMGRNTALASAACLRFPGKPFYISEWDMPWPNEYRAESPILYAAIGLMQHWSGFAIHTYAYTTDLENMKMLGKEISASSIGGIPYREGIFSAWNDPAKFGLFYHAAIMTRRGDVKADDDGLLVYRSDLKRKWHGPAFEALELRRLSACYEIPDGKEWVEESEEILPESAGEVTSATGELYRSWEKGYGTVDTPMTQCIYGSLAKNGALSTANLTVKMDTDFAVLAVSSLTKEPLGRTPNLLFTAVGRARNAGSSFEGSLMTSYGHPPIELQVICGEISIKTECATLSVWAVSAEGLYIGKLPAVYKDGILRFRIGDTFPSMYYLIQSE